MRDMTPEVRERYDNYQRARHGLPFRNPVVTCKGGPFDGQGMAAPETGATAEFHMHGWRGKYVLAGGVLHWRGTHVVR